MSDVEDHEQLSPQRTRRGWKRFFLRGLLFLGIVGTVVVVGRWQVARIGERHLKVIVDRLDADDPHWRLEHLEADRRHAAPPPELNSAEVILELHATVPAAWHDHRKTRSWDWGVVTNHRPSFWEFAWLMGASKATAEARDSGRARLLRPELLAQPSGYYTLTLNENPYLTLLPHVEKARGVLDLLDYDARLSVLEKDPNRAIRAARAALMVSRSFGDEPYLISQLVRLAANRISVQTALQVLAWSEPKEGLAELQAEFRTEANYPWLEVGLRGERASLNKIFEGLKAGKISADDVTRLSDQTPGRLQNASFRLYKAMLPGDQAKSLELLTDYIEAAKLPSHEQAAAMARIKLPPRPPDDFRYIGTLLLVPACTKVTTAAIRCRADLLTASIAIACERYRLANGRWPNSLADIPREILPDVPLDPYSGQPLLYRKLPDGIAVLSVGDGDQATIQRRKELNDPLAEMGQGWRLWNPELRGVPSPPPKPDPNGGTELEEQ